jgi:hypothetical protein
MSSAIGSQASKSTLLQISKATVAPSTSTTLPRVRAYRGYTGPDFGKTTQFGEESEMGSSTHYPTR